MRNRDSARRAPGCPELDNRHLAPANFKRIALYLLRFIRALIGSCKQYRVPILNWSVAQRYWVGYVHILGARVTQRHLQLSGVRAWRLCCGSAEAANHRVSNGSWVMRWLWSRETAVGGGGIPRYKNHRYDHLCDHRRGLVDIKKLAHLVLVATHTR